MKVEAALPASCTTDQNEEVMKLAYSTIILHLGDKVMRQVKKMRYVAKSGSDWRASI